MSFKSTTSPSSAQPSGWWRYLRLEPGVLLRRLLAAIIIGELFLIYHFQGVTDVGYDAAASSRSAFGWIYNRWHADWHQTLFAHSHLIPLISLALVLWDWRALVAQPKKMNPAGLVVIVLGLAMHWAGVKSEQTRLTILSMITLAWGIPLFVAGWPVARRLIFPCGFLIFSLPLNFFDSLAYSVRMVIAMITGLLTNGLGMEVSRQGANLTSAITQGAGPDFTDSRTGVFAITAMVAWACLCAFIARLRWIGFALVVGAAIPLIILANVIRGTVVMMGAAVAGSAVSQHLDRLIAGPFVCLIGFGGVVLVAIMARRIWPQTATPTTNQSGTNHQSLPALVITASILAMAAWWIPGNLTITHIDQAGVRLDLPDQFGRWHGGTLLFCHRNHQPNQFFEPTLKVGDPCPVCQEPLQEMSQIERALLPPDTTVRKYQYSDMDKGSPLNFSIVLSGKHRSSIHRPEVCLVGPNSQIADSYLHTITLDNGNSITVKILEMVHTYTQPNGKQAFFPSYYAYWFVGLGQETPSHTQRMIWMATDRLFHNRSYRWAYTSLSGYRTTDRTSYLKEIDAFIRGIHPELIIQENVAIH